MIPAAERIARAHVLIQEARDLPVPAENGRYDLNYVAQVKDLLKQARDLIKFISYSPSATDAMKTEIAGIFKEVEQAERDILNRL
jgi:hypothetical protein